MELYKKCYKGTPDELNNALLETYSLHKQEYPLLITRKVTHNIGVGRTEFTLEELDNAIRDAIAKQIQEAAESSVQR